MALEHVICQAIEKRRLLTLTYKGENRTVEPYILGYDRHGELYLSAVQVKGGSGFGFRSFPLSGISALTISERHFARDNPDYNPRDRFFASIVCQV